MVSINAFLVLPPYHGMKDTNIQGSSSVETEDCQRRQNVPQHQATNSGGSSLSSSPVERTIDSRARNVTDGSDESEEKYGPVKMDGVQKATQDQEQEEEEQHYTATTTTTSSSSDEIVKHRQSAAQQEESSDASDENLETVLIFQRNKKVLISRLYETAPRGRLSLINLARRGVGVEEAKLLKEVILANPQLSVLKLSYNTLGDEGAEIIASSLQLPTGGHHTHLSILDLGFNSIGDCGCEAIAVHALAGNHNLQTLCLSGNQIGEKGALSIAGAMLHGSTLLKLYLTANKIGPIGMKAIAGAVVKNDQLVATAEADGMSKTVQSMQELHLGTTEMLSDGFLSIPAMLLTNKSLRMLCLGNNHFDDQDMIVLSQALSQNKDVPLETLRLSFNEITCMGVEYVMNAIWGSKTLKELKLDNNNIQDRGAQLCAVVLTSIALESLDLSLNRITTVGIKALMKNISENMSLRTIGLTGITIDQNASKAVAFALAFNSSLQAIYMDNCNAGYSAQRHIVAGVVSNRTSSLRVLAGFHLAPIAMTLGMPRLPEEWTNDQVLCFFRFMWKQWILKSGRGTGVPQETRGPAPPAAVAAAAKIALSSLGSASKHLFHTQPHERPASESPPVDPAHVSLLERTDSGTLSIPVFADSAYGQILDPVIDEMKAAADTLCISAVRSPLDNPETRNKNLQWLRNHFRSLNDVGRLPFNNGDLWQLHQYYFSPPYYPNDGDKASSSSSSETDSSESAEAEVNATPAFMATSLSTGRAVSFQTLGDAFAVSGVTTSRNAHKRRSEKNIEVTDGPATKRPRNLKPRIAYYPRLMLQLESLGTRPMEQTLALLRQLKYTENVMFAENKDPYADSLSKAEQQMLSDIEMILLDLL